ncbi:hypothetical protein H1R17_09990 [Flavobacterium sp. xlx-214]|uniref:DUF6624 domain-containing protein n=1 Tax=unclassified Flavobacterium TaxID=196869 RepID=UPI0013D16C9F|nr:MULTISPECIES: DUF6624 domain-containing protein [unclassified Flavobacterium]MBA5793431.1 hypothetical protein [Flavobacterium sp. xlx-221]QMI82796.1 hypothetical protein H1R17_09990 [Flavobacterium sp. xlx-214]
MKNEYSIELIQMEKHDLHVREKLLKENKLTSGYDLEMENVHQSNAKRLREIIDKIGFPTISKVGRKASDAAWLIIQHAISEPIFMENSYKLMLENQTDINLKNIAFLYDRIQFFKGKPQKFGTQLNSDGTIYPVESKENLNNEREKYNLYKLSDLEIEKIPNIDKIEQLENENHEYILWRQKVGWK